MRVQVTTMRLNGQPLTDDNSDQQTTTSGELTIDSELVGELAAQVTVARLKADGTTQSDELLTPLVDAKLTELSDDTFALTGIEVRGVARFAQAWYCKVHVWKPVVSSVTALANNELAKRAEEEAEHGR
ncbi:hypothetical protein [Pararobbsia alpina]|uniref:Uncharacterized protein n=1 Tax=Pararobbsia alpina TaxID=621374 RepID=A0A6S7BEA8_9BURK|nr:hypothetical protein [Pararobbsia alpina]CAB3797140.1 hypothetical protein LMG28138_04196 [Pararobbsia alpina]